MVSTNYKKVWGFQKKQFHIIFRYNVEKIGSISVKINNCKVYAIAKILLKDKTFDKGLKNKFLFNFSYYLLKQH